MSERGKKGATEVFVTKYALTDDIFTTSTTAQAGEYIWAQSGRAEEMIGPDGWVRTKEEAIAKFWRMRDERVKSLKQQLADLEALTGPKFAD